MALGGILAAALTDHSARAKALWVGSVDVLKQPGTTLPGYGTPIETVRVTEEGPGGVSKMSFTIDDPNRAITISDGDDVLFQNITLDYPVFAGTIETATVTPDFGGQGRTIKVSAVGRESVLDWAILRSDLTIASGTLLSNALQSIVAQAYGTGPLRDSLSSSNPSTQAGPIAGLTTSPSLQAALTVSAGTTLREALRQAIALTFSTVSVGISSTTLYMVTVDFYYGLRVYAQSTTSTPASDFRTVDVSDAVVSAAARSTELEYTTDGATVRAVYIKGGNAAGTGTFTDGSGRIGQTAYVSDPTILDAATANAAGSAYLAQYALKTTGSMTLENVAPATYDSSTIQARPGGWLTFTDASVVTGTVTHQIFGIGKTFYPGGTEDWAITFGTLAPSGAALIRQLTYGNRPT